MRTHVTNLRADFNRLTVNQRRALVAFVVFAIATGVAVVFATIAATDVAHQVGDAAWRFAMRH